MLRTACSRVAALGIVLGVPQLGLAQSSIERLSDATSVPVSSIASVPIGTMRFVTAVRSGAPCG